MVHLSSLPHDWVTDRLQFEHKLQPTDFVPGFAKAANQEIDGFIYFRTVPAASDQPEAEFLGSTHPDDVGKRHVSGAQDMLKAVDPLAVAVENFGVKLETSIMRLADNFGKPLVESLATASCFPPQSPSFESAERYRTVFHQRRDAVDNSWPNCFSASVQKHLLSLPMHSIILVAENCTSGPFTGFSWAYVDSLPGAGAGVRFSRLGDVGLVLTRHPQRTTERFFLPFVDTLMQEAPGGFFDDE